jgi:hypothetical protein
MSCEAGHGIGTLDWSAAAQALDAEGFATTPPILDRATCRRLRACFDDTGTRFRSTVDMAQYNFGRGRYRYFDYPLPDTVQALREAFYPPLAAIANAWSQRLGLIADWPASLAALTQRCHAEGQTRPTPLLLRYHTDDYNCLHQDLYGPIHFPLQVIVMLSEPGVEFEGGELILVEQRPRMQSRPMVVPLERGAAAIIPVRERPRHGVRGHHRVQLRHGVGRIRRGSRTTLGLIFHDAR